MSFRQPQQMDFRTLTFQSQVTPFNYPLEYGDLSIDRSQVHPALRDKEYIIVESYMNVTVSLTRMEQYVFAGNLSPLSDRTKATH